MIYKRSSALFDEAKKYIPGGVNSPVRAFNAVGGDPIFVKKAEGLPKTIYIQNCPMADDNSGADWLSYSDAIRNPYFGSAMLKCGSVIDSIFFKPPPANPHRGEDS